MCGSDPGGKERKTESHSPRPEGSHNPGLLKTDFYEIILHILEIVLFNLI